MKWPQRLGGLPELVIETETTAFERQERPNAAHELLKGQRKEEGIIINK